MKNINLYSGFEGYSELVLKEKNNTQILFEVHLLDFHFNEVLALIPLGQYHDESVMSNFLKVEGWHNGQWECKRKQEFNDQLVLIENNVPQDLLSVYNAIKQICVSSIQNNNKLFLELE